MRFDSFDLIGFDSFCKFVYRSRSACIYTESKMCVLANFDDFDGKEESARAFISFRAVLSVSGRVYI